MSAEKEEFNLEPFDLDRNIVYQISFSLLWEKKKNPVAVIIVLKLHRFDLLEVVFIINVSSEIWSEF